MEKAVISEPELTAMQVGDDEDFILMASSGIYEKLQGVDLMNIIWQQILMDAKKNQNAEIDTGSLVDTLIKLAALKRGEVAWDEMRSSFTVILIILKPFKDKVAKYLQMSEQTLINHFGLLRKDAVDEIELEPIENQYDELLENDLMAEGYDELLYRHDDSGKKKGKVGRQQLLSEICEIPDEDEQSTIQPLQLESESG